MKTILRNIFAVFIGIFVGGAVNMALIIIGPLVIPPPAGVDMKDLKSINDNIHLFEPKHLVFAFLAHALGTLAGALLAFLIAGSYRSVFAYTIGIFFLAGGIAAATMIHAPMFIVVDLVAAYIPMAWIGIQLGQRILGIDRKITSVFD